MTYFVWGGMFNLNSVNKLLVPLLNCLAYFLPSLLAFLYFLLYLFTSLLIYFLTYLFTSSRIGSFRFQAIGCRKRPNLALVFCVKFCCSIFCYGCMFAFVVCFSFSVLSQEIGWEVRLQNDLCCVGWDVKP